MNFNKGEWKLCKFYEGDKCTHEDAPPDGRECIGFDLCAAWEDDIQRSTSTELKANANLIAAAPIGDDLAQAVIDANFDDYFGWLELQEIARKFKAKIEGGK